MNPASDVTNFGRVDEQSDPDYFVRFVDEAVVLGEMVRVTRPDGRVVVVDIDMDGLAMDIPDLDPHVLRRAVHAMSDAMAGGQIGRRLPRLFREAKLEDVTYRAAMIAF